MNAHDSEVMETNKRLPRHEHEIRFWGLELDGLTVEEKSCIMKGTNHIQGFYAANTRSS